MTMPSNRVSCGSRHEAGATGMRCEECSDKLDRFVDRELNNTEALEVQLHLEGCPDCMEHYEFQEHLKRVVRRSWDCDTAPHALRDKARQLLRGNLRPPAVPAARR